MAFRIRKHLRNLFWGTYEDVMNPLLKREKTKWISSERIFENAYCIGNIYKTYPKNVLDIGCARSTIPLELATLGFQVTGVDMRAYPLTHSSFTFINGDFIDLKFDSKFDFIICVSVFEHVGLGAYNEKPDEFKIKTFAEKIVNVLDTDGHLILTVPLYTQKAGFIKYLSLHDIKNYFKELKLIEERFFVLTKGIYVECEHQDQKEMTSCFLLKK